MCTGLSGEPTAPAANSRQRNQRETRGLGQQSLSRTGLSGAQASPTTNSSFLGKAKVTRL
jgi:hypothetical protein